MKKDEIAFNKPAKESPFRKEQNRTPEDKDCKAASEQPQEKTGSSVSVSLKSNIEQIDLLFREDETFQLRRFQSEGAFPLQCAVCFLDGMCDDKSASEFYVKAVTEKRFDSPLSETALTQEVFYGNDFNTEAAFGKAVESILAGNSVYFIEGFPFAVLADTKGYKSRTPTEPDGEKALNGPREGFCEEMMTNLSLLRRRLKTTQFKIRFLTVGQLSGTKVAVCWLQGTADERILREITEKIEAIQIDGIVDTNYIEELICPKGISPFKIIGSTERPDSTAAKLLEGKIAVVVDGTPMVMTVPYLFIENFISPDDYYLHYIYGSVMRILRIACFFLTICLPGLFVALLTYHSQMLPTDFILSLIAAREGVPFPAIIECFGLLGVFEILRETGVRVSSAVGQPLSIVGALVLGEAAISAKYVSAPMVIIVAMACLTGLMLQKIKGAVIVYRLLILFSSAFLGLYGFLFAVAGLFFHLLTIRSFGVQYFGYSPIPTPRGQRDIFIRPPFRPGSHKIRRKEI